MDKPVGMQIPSAQFRKTYPRLTVPTLVTVNGHVIGTWIPGTDGTVATVGASSVRVAARPAPATYEVTTKLSGGNVPRPFAEFRPAPKPGKGK